jgi:hypothetical protein
MQQAKLMARPIMLIKVYSLYRQACLMAIFRKLLIIDAANQSVPPAQRTILFRFCRVWRGRFQDTRSS